MAAPATVMLAVPAAVHAHLGLRVVAVPPAAPLVEAGVVAVEIKSPLA